ncbi:phage tail tape measure protein [Lachnospiraceae bacterium MD329]|nr:phage tail tape measure protein [Lachnospiraceae bacterium MD329]
MGKELDLAIKIGGRLDKSLGSAVNNAQKQLNSISKVANNVGMAVTAGVVTAGTKLVVDSVNTYKGYQSALNSAAATAGIERGTAEYEAMDAAAREAGRTTVKTAQESANALEYMALAGWSVEDSTKALMPVLKLSAATGAELATTSDLVTDSMANLGLGINDLNHYLDVSATANNKSNQTAMQLQEAYLGVGGVLKNLNSPIEESAAVLGVLANRGTKGSEAGTALNAILVNMQKRSGDAYKAMSKLGVSMYDSSGKARSIIDVFKEISDKTSGMTEENRNLMYQMIGGKSHLDSFAKIMQGFTTDTADGTKEIYSLINAFNNCDGALDKLYGIKTDTLEGSILTLNSAFDDMKISIGEKIAPTLNDAVKNLTEKMPEIEDVIVSSLERIIPAMSKILNYVVDNADSIISVVTNIAKAFIGFKITTGAIKSINNIATLGKNLNTLRKAAGGAKVLKGIIGTFTGVSTTAGTFGGAVTGVVGTLVSSVVPLAAVAGGFVAVGLAAKGAYQIWYNSNYKWGKSLEKQANIVRTSADELTKLTGYKKELSDLELIINSPSSSSEQVNVAQSRVKEIAELLSKEYNLNINTDTNDLKQVVDDVKTVVDALNIGARKEFNQNFAKYQSDLNSKVNTYKTAQTKLPEMQVNRDKLSKDSEFISGYLSSAVTQANAYNISGDLNSYASNMQKIAQKFNEAGLLDKINENMPKAINPDKISEELTDIDTIQNFLNSIHKLDFDTNKAFTEADNKLKDTQTSISQAESSATQAADSISRVLASDVLSGNTVNVENDIERFKTLGQTMIDAGMNTADIAMQFAMAKSGYTEFSKAIENGKAAEMAQNFIDFKKSIGDTSESAVSGAALIASQFETIEQATAKGNDGILAVVNNMKSLGDAQHLFDGLDVDGVANKLTNMARAMKLIPKNKTISIDANGNLSIIDVATDKINNVPEKHSTSIIAIDNTSDGVEQARNNLKTIKNKTVTISVQSIPIKGAGSGSPASLIGSTGMFKVDHQASGTSNFGGGLTYVNDQNISDPREVIEYGGRRWWYEGKNVLTDLPRGAKIYNALQSRAFINGSHRNGLERVPFDGYIAELHAGERVLTDSEASDYRENGLFAQAIERLKEFLSGGKPKPQDDNGGNDKQVVFAPTYQIYGNADREEIRQGGKLSFKDFKEFYELMKRNQRRTQF